MKQLSLFGMSMLVAFAMLCSCNPGKYEAEKERLQEITDSLEAEVEAAKGLVLYENRIGKVELPLSDKFVELYLIKQFEGYKVDLVLEVGEGGEIPHYNVSQDSTELLSFAMYPEDPDKLFEMIISNDQVPDQYGLKVGDSYTDIIAKRGDSIKVKMGYHFHTYASYKGSRILYEISGDYQMPDDLMMQTINEHKFKEGELDDWRIVRVLWMGEGVESE